MEERDTVFIKYIKGIKIAFVNYTYGTNGIPVPSDKPYLVNLIDKDLIAKDNLETYGINSRKNLATASKIMKDRYLEELMENGVTIVDPDTTFISPETKISSDTIIYPNTFITGKNEPTVW